MDRVSEDYLPYRSNVLTFLDTERRPMRSLTGV